MVAALNPLGADGTDGVGVGVGLGVGVAVGVGVGVGSGCCPIVNVSITTPRRVMNSKVSALALAVMRIAP
jgi:hypothetical protein